MSDVAPGTDETARSGLAEIEVSGPDGRPVALYHLAEDGDYIIGRDRETADILLDDKSVSRRHALLRCIRSTLVIADAGSLNGTIIGDGRRSGVAVSTDTGALEWLDWPEGATATIGIFTLAWRPPSEPASAISADAGPRVVVTTLGADRAEARKRIAEAMAPEPPAYPATAEAMSPGGATMATLLGRWQMRIMLFVLSGLPLSLLFGWGQSGWQGLAPEPLALVATMLAVGLLLDPVYDRLQRFRWHPDWLFARVTASLIIEFAIALVAARGGWLPGLEACRLARIDRLTRQLVCVDYAIPLDAAFWMFLAILVASLLFVVGGPRVFFRRWRFKRGTFGLFHRDDA